MDIGLEFIKIDSHLVNDLNADSLDLVELSMIIENSFDVALDDSELDNAQTVNDLYTILKKHKLDF